MISLKPVLLVIGLIFLFGCANVQTQQEWERVKAFSVERTGIETYWEQTEEDVKVIKEEVSKLLSDGLTEDDAVRIALLNNRKLQASFEEIGVAKADLVQAGLLTNPDLSAIFRFPFGGGGTNIEAAGLLKISDFWQIPLRKKVSHARLETIMLKVSEEILNTSTEAKHVYNEYIALFQIREEAKKIKRQLEEFREHLIYRQKFGLTKDIDIHVANSAVFDQEAELVRIEKDLRVSRLRLNRVLGLFSDQSSYEVTGRLNEQFRQIPDSETLVAYALSMRPDIQISKWQIEESRRVLALERKRIFSNVDAGAAYERDTDGTDFLGPKVKLQVPFFDQNQAKIAKAEYRVRQAEKEFQNKEGVVREEVSAASESILLFRKEIELIRDQILPARNSAVEYAEKYFDAMQLNMFYLLEARQKLIETRRRYLEVLRNQRSQEIELERVIGGKIPVHETQIPPVALSFFAGPVLVIAEKDHCEKEGMIVKNLTLTTLWYKRDGGDCYIWQRNKIFVLNSEDRVDIFSDLTCETKYCKDLTYKDYKSFDENGNCSVRILSGCNLSDM